MRTILRTLAAALAISLAACSSSGPLAPFAGSAGSAFARPARRQLLDAVLRIVIPPRARGARPSYISASTKSLVFVVTRGGVAVPGGSGYVNLTPSSPECVAGSLAGELVCTISIPLQVSSSGSYMFALATYDAPQAGPTGTAPCTPPSSRGCAGRLLSQNVGSERLVEGRLNVVSFTLGGIPSSIRVTPVSPGYMRGGGTSDGSSANALRLTLWGAQTQLISVQALDADGNVIIGPGMPDLGVTSADPSKLAVVLLPAPPTLLGIFGLRAVTSGTPPVVTPGDVGLTVAATPVAGSGGTTLTVRARVKIEHSIVYVSTGGGPGTIFGYYDGNTAPSTRVDLRPFLFTTIHGVATFGDPPSVYAANLTEITRCPQNAAMTASCQDAVRGLLFPVGVAIDSDATLYVANAATGSVWRCPRIERGRPQCEVRYRNLPFSEAGLAVDSGRTLYIANPLTSTLASCPPGNSARCRTQRLGFRPYGIAVGTKSIVYVSSPFEHRVYACPNLAGCTATVFGIDRPLGIAVDAANALYVADAGRHEVLICPLGASSSFRRCEPLVHLGPKLWPSFVAVVPAAVNP